MSEVKSVGRYRVVRELGRGGMGVVHLVEEPGRAEPIALKLLHAGRFSDSALRHFEQEFRLLTGVTHPNLTEVYDFGRLQRSDEPVVPYFTMEYVEGQPIHRAFRPGEADLRPLFVAVAQVGQALAYLHARGWVHQDVKPSNILVGRTPEGPRVKLMDLGLAGRPGDAPGGGVLRGTPAYIAPEVARGGAPDPRSDLYALGCSVFEVLTGRTPFQGATAAALLRAHLEDTPVAPSTIRPGLPAELDEIVLKLLARDPGLRFAGVPSFLAAWNEAAGGDLDVSTPSVRRSSVLGGGFVGRETELARLEERLERTRSGRGRLVLVEGEAGVGKSRLLREFQVRSQLRDVDVFVGRADAADEIGTPLAKALRAAAAARGGGAVGAAPADLEEADRRPEAIGEWLAAGASDGPIVLGVEDLHEADEPTCAALVHLAQAAAGGSDGSGVPLLLVGTYRGAEVSRSSPLFDLLAAGRDAGFLDELFLGPLGLGEVRSLLRAMIGAESIPDPFVERVVDETHGNPLHVQELLAVLAEDGVIEPGTGEPPAADVLDGVRVPGRIRELLARRLGTLPEESARVLRAAGHLEGPVVDPDAIAAIGGLRWEHVVDRLRDLVARGWLLRDDEPGGSPSYRFASRAMAELAARSSEASETTRFHRQATVYFERRGVPRRHAAWASLARHAERGGLPGRALEAYGRAADLAVETHALREAVLLYGEAISLATRSADASATVLCGLYERRGRAHAVGGDLAKAEEDFRWMLARAEKDGSDPLRSRAHLRLGEVLGRTGREDESRESLEISWSIAERDGDGATLASAALELGRLAARTGDHADAERQLDTARHAWGRAGRPERAAEALLLLGELRRDHGDYDGALQCFREAEELADDAAEGRTASAIREAAALALEVRGDFPGALEALDVARSLARGRGDVHAIARLTSRLAQVRMRLGDLAGAARDFDEALATYERMGDREGAIENRLGIARMHLDRGRYETAQELADTAERMSETVGRRDLAAAVLELQGEIHLRLGDFERAAERFGEAERRTRDTRNDRVRATLSLRAGELALARGAAEEARTRFQEAAFVFRRIGDRRLEATATGRLGEAHLASADHDRARVACRKALSLVESASLPREEAAARLLAARIELAAPGGDIVRAEQDALFALEKFRWLGEPERSWHAEHVAGRASARLGRTAEGRSRIERAHRFLEKVRARLGDRWQTTFLNDPRRRELYDDHERLRAAGGGAAATTDAGATGELARARDEAAALRRLLEVTRTLNRTRDLDELLGAVLDAALELTEAERGILLERSNEDGLVVRHARGRGGERLDDASIELSRTVAERVVGTGEALLSTDTTTDRRLAPIESVHELQIRSVLAVPLAIQDERIGVVYLDSRFGRGSFRDGHLDLARLLADQAALAIDGARMLTRIESQRGDLERLNRELEKVVAEQREEIESVREELTSSRTSFELRYRFENLIGASAGMQRVYHLIERLAPKRLPVLVTGESGTGKELIARAVHAQSERREGPFFTVNCAALNESLLESELFGYRKGAFTGADRDKPGYFELADGGTLFLDEIGEMGPAMQAKLLRVIERGEVLPVGGKATVQVDVRIVAATHRDLPSRIAEGSFREDLYYRVNVGRIHVPPLRERLEDIPLLVEHFLRRIAEDEGRKPFEIEPAALKRLARWRWPGNVRELQHQVLRVCAFAKGPTVTLRQIERYADLGDDERGTEAATADDGPVESLEETERKQIVRALEEAGGNRTRAAELLGINRATLFRKIKRLELDV